ncbi:MAG: hypothetical protein IJ213_06375 [Bacteroidales bacterium]|nr:hypothetical protein [Bacteroidales bacterium]
MKLKTKTRILCGCGSVVSLVILVLCGSIFYMTRDGRIAKDPEKIADEAGFDLPAYTIVSKFDNMERHTSAWSNYTWKLQLKKPLSEKDIKNLKKLVEKNAKWTYNPDNHTYDYHSEENERYLSITIDAVEGKVTMDYEWLDFLA